jgi:hypothetical protein
MAWKISFFNGAESELQIAVCHRLKHARLLNPLAQEFSFKF